METQIKAHDYPEVYKGLGLNLNTLSCVMIDIDSVAMIGLLAEKDILNFAEANKEDLYTSKDKDKFWVDGLVCQKSAHCTLLYGLIEAADNYSWHIKKVLTGWKIDSLEIESVDSFDSPTEDEPYYCIVGHVKITPELLEGHQRLELLPHINTFGGYKAHISLAYIKKDAAAQSRWVKTFSKALVGEKLKVEDTLNFGGNK